MYWGTEYQYLIMEQLLWGGKNEIGNYSVLHTCVVISGNGKKIGDALYVGTGAKITGKIFLGNSVSIGANSVVTNSIKENNVLVVGVPAGVKKKCDTWYERDGEFYKNRVNMVEQLREKLYLG